MGVWFISGAGLSGVEVGGSVRDGRKDGCVCVCMCVSPMEEEMEEEVGLWARLHVLKRHPEVLARPAIRLGAVAFVEDVLVVAATNPAPDIAAITPQWSVDYLVLFPCLHGCGCDESRSSGGSSSSEERQCLWQQSARSVCSSCGRRYLGQMHDV